MLQFKEASSPRTLERFGRSFAFYEDDDAGTAVDFLAKHAPGDVTDLDEVSFLVHRLGSTNAGLATSVIFRDGCYVVEFDHAPFTRAEVTDMLDFCLAEVPKLFPNIVLPDGYPAEARRI